MHDQDGLIDRMTDSLLADDRSFLDGLTGQERVLALQIMQEMTQDPALASITYQKLWEVDYWEKPVDIDTFLNDPRYMGKHTAELYPAWREDMRNIFAPGANFLEWIFGGAIGIGKSTVGTLANAYVIYRNACLRDPHAYYGLLKGAPIVYGIFSVTKAQVMDVGYTKLKSYIDACPWFVEKYPRNQQLDSRVQFKKTPMEVRAGSREFHALGQDILTFFMDEVNFMRGNSSKKKQEDPGEAMKLYNACKTRLKSRFMRPGGGCAGMVYLVSSKKSVSSFLEQHISDSRDDISNGLTYLSEYALWEVKNKSLFTLPKFRVEVGDQVYPSRILPKGEEGRDNAQVITVPGEYRTEFDRDVDLALRDLAGVATFGLSPLFRDRTVIYDCVSDELQHPMTRQELEIGVNDSMQIHDFLLPERMFRVERSSYVMRRNPQAPRFWHLDIGLKRDGAGLSIGHVAGWRTVDRLRPDGTYFKDRVPSIEIDLLLLVRAPKGSEVDLSKLRTFLISLRDMGVPLLKGSTDGFQSVDTRQILSKVGFECTLLSCDRSPCEPYLMTRSAVNEQRVTMYAHDHLIQELSELEHDTDAEKVDHPAKRADGTPGSKDVADALAGVVYHCMTDHRSAARVGDVMPNFAPSLAKSQARAISTASGKVDWNALDNERRSIKRRIKR